LKLVGRDERGAVRAVELAGPPFYVASLFLPQLNSTAEPPPPLIVAFLQAAMQAKVP